MDINEFAKKSSFYFNFLIEEYGFIEFPVESCASGLLYLKSYKKNELELRIVYDKREMFVDIKIKNFDPDEGILGSDLIKILLKNKRPVKRYLHKSSFGIDRMLEDYSALIKEQAMDLIT